MNPIDIEQYIRKRIMWTNVKPILNRPHRVMQGLVQVTARTKGGRTVKADFCGTALFYLGERVEKKLIKIKQENVVHSMVDFLGKRQGIKGYKGRFILTQLL